MNEHRRAERKTIISFMPVYEVGKNILLGYLRDLTVMGAMLEGHKPVDVRSELTLTIEFHAIPEFQATRMTIPARVVWCNHLEHSSYYNTGVEFLRLTEQDESMLSVILERFQFRPEPSPLPEN